MDRVEFSRLISEAIAAGATDSVSIARKSRTSIRHRASRFVASGPLTSNALSDEIARLTGSDHLSFYDSISPIVEADSIDMKRVYFAARWDKGTADYINCPFSKEEYDVFYDALVAAEAVEAKEWEKLDYFRRVPAHRGDRASRPRYAAIWLYEAGGFT